MKKDRIKGLYYYGAALLLLIVLVANIAMATTVEGVVSNQDKAVFDVEFVDAQGNTLDYLFVMQGTDISNMAPELPSPEMQWQSNNAVSLYAITDDTVFAPVVMQSYPMAEGRDLRQFVHAEETDRYGVHLYKEDSLIAITSDLVLTFDVPYTIRVDFHVDKVIEPGVAYTYTLPAALIGRTGEERIFANEAGLELGKASIENDTVIVFFSEAAADMTASGATFDFFYWCTQELKKSEIGDSETVDVVIPLDEGEIEVTITINREREFPTVASKGAWFVRGNPSRFYWQIRLLSGVNYHQSIILEDELLLSEGYQPHKGIIGSFVYKYEDGRIVDLEQPVWNEERTAFTLEIPSEVFTEDIIILYNTEVVEPEHLIDAELEGKQVTYGNQARLVEQATQEPMSDWVVADISKTVDMITKSLDKSSTVIDGSDIYYVWYVAIMRPSEAIIGFPIKSTTKLVDKLPGWLAFDSVYADDGLSVPITADTGAKPYYTFDASSNTLEVVWEGGVAAGTAVYIKTKYLPTEGNIEEANRVELLVEGNENDAPVAEAGHDKGITKGAFNFSSQTGIQKYRIIVNSSHDALTNVVLQDVFRSDWFTFKNIEIDGVTLDEANPAGGGYTLQIVSNGEVRLEMGDITTQKVIYVSLDLKQEKYHSMGDPVNVGYLYGNQGSYDFDPTGNDWLYTASDSAPIALSYQLVKSFISYNNAFLNKGMELKPTEMVWRIVFTRIGDGLYGEDSVIYDDTLSEGQTVTEDNEKFHLIFGSYSIFGLDNINEFLSTNTAKIKGTVTVKEDRSGVLVQMEQYDSGAMFALHYVTDVSEAYLATGATAVSNAVVVRGTYLSRKHELNSSSKGNVIMKTIDKTGFQTTEGSATWQVLINEQKTVLVENTVLTPRVVLTDHLSDARLQFLGPATIRFTKQDGSEVQDWHFDYVDNILKIDFPAEELNSNTLTLQFDVGVMDHASVADPFVNSVSMQAEGSYQITSPGYVWEMASGAGASDGGSLLVTKVAANKQPADSGYYLRDAMFVLYDFMDLTTPAFGPLATDASGNILFTGLKPNYSYILQELVAPGGYQLLDSSYGLLEHAMLVKAYTGAEVALNPVTVANQPIAGGFDLYKIGEEEEVILSSPATFELRINGTALSFEQLNPGVYTYEALGAQSALSTADGKLTVLGLPEGKYSLIETIAPTGYKLSETTWVVEVNIVDDQPVLNISGDFEDGILRVANVAQTGQFELRKIDSEGDPILASPAVFTLSSEGTLLTFTKINEVYTQAAEGTVTELETVDGMLNVQGLQPGTYLLTETKAPEGFLPQSIPWNVTVGIASTGIDVTVDRDFADGMLSVVNQRVTGQFALQKTDANGDLIVTGNAAFELLDGTVPLTFTQTGDSYIYTENSGVAQLQTLEGKLTVVGLPVGDYILRETTPPAGFKLSSDEWHIAIRVVDADVQVEIDGDYADGILTVPNEPLTGGFGVRKIDDAGLLITGSPAVFTLSDATTTLPFVRVGAVYTYMANGNVTQIETVDGKFAIEGLPAGTYLLNEVQAPQGYHAATHSWIVVVSADDENAFVAIDGEYADGMLTVPNTALTAGFDIQKTNAAKDLITQGVAVFIMSHGTDVLSFTQEDAGRYAYDSKGEITRLKTANGRLSIAGLPVGNYSLAEVQSPLGYHLADTVWNVTVIAVDAQAHVQIDGDFSAGVLSVVNRRVITGGLEIGKVDTNGRTIASGEAEFTMLDGDTPVRFLLQEGVYTFDADGTITQMRTIGGGLSIRNLPEGRYSLMETKAPSGYRRSNTIWNISVAGVDGQPDVTVTGNYQNGTLKVTNAPATELPQTGDFLDRNLLWILFEVSAIILIVAAIRKVKRMDSMP